MSKPITKKGCRAHTKEEADRMDAEKLWICEKCIKENTKYAPTSCGGYGYCDNCEGYGNVRVCKVIADG